MVRIKLLAYASLFAHAAKNFDLPILGYLIGVDEDGKGYSVVNEVVPVCHSIPAGPMIELAACIAEKIAKSSNMKVLGVYFACDNIDNEATPPLFIERIVSSIVKTFKNNNCACTILQVKNNLLASKDKIFLEILTAKKNCSESFARSTSKVELEHGCSIDTASRVLDSILVEKKENSFEDFEDHCNCGMADFRNTWLKSFVSSI